MNELIQAAFTSLDGDGAPFTFWIAGIAAVFVAATLAGVVGNYLADLYNAARGKDKPPLVARRGVRSPE